MVVIAAVDRSDRATAVASEAGSLARAFGDVVHVIHVLSRSTFVELEQTETRRTGRAADMDRVRSFAERVAADVAAEIDDAEAVGLVGSPADMVVEYADDHDARFVVLGPRKRSPAGKAVFGSVAQSVLLGAPCPAVTLPVRERHRSQN